MSNPKEIKELKRKDHNYPAWVEIDLKAIRHNYRETKKLAQKQFAQGLPPELSSRKAQHPQILAVVKADAYGHGMLKTVSVLNQLGVGFLGVSDVAEGILLRKHGVKKPILLFESTLPSCVKEVIDYHLTPSVCTLTLAKALNTYAQSVKRKVQVHVKVDTGMGRLGVLCEEAKDFITQIMRLPFLSVRGIYTHFPVADINPDFTKKQINQLYHLVKTLDKKSDIIPYIHAANSVGLAGYLCPKGYKTRILNLVRPGLMLYGLYPAPKLKRKIPLRPVMSVKARIIFLKKIPQGAGISYGHTFVAQRNMTVATLAIGYSDGYLRSLSNKACVLIGGQRCPVIGRVTMDQIMVDVSRTKTLKLGMEATILGRQKRETISADELAAQAGTINYEIVCQLGNRLPRVYQS